MILPIPTLGPPPIPDHAVPWLVVKVIGKAVVDNAWGLCWWSGVATGIVGLLAVQVSILIVLEAARRRRP